VAEAPWAGWALLAVVLLQGTVAWTLRLIDPPPAYLNLARDLWAREHEPAFWPVVALLLAGPILTAFALWRGRWPTRLATLALWPGWLWLLHRLDELTTLRTMLAVLWQHKL